MKPRAFIVVLSLLGCLMLVLWLWPAGRHGGTGTNPAETPRVTSPPLTEKRPEASLLERRNSLRSEHPGRVPSLGATNGPTDDDPFKASTERALARFQEDWKKPIAFYGKVLDEANQPVPQTDISFLWSDVSPSGTSSAETKSDQNGLFSIEGITGRALTVQVSKAGYYTVTKGAQFEFEYARDYEPTYHRPDPANPVIFRLRKRGPGADLITSEYGVKKYLPVPAPLNAVSVHVDLLNRQTGGSGPLEFSQLKPEYAQWEQAKSWSVHLAIPDGGFVEQDDEFPFEPPESGYRPVLDFRFEAGQTNWTTDLVKRYYIAFGQPRRYGWLSIDTDIGMEGARMRYAINPNGSRYLEPKPPMPPPRREPPPGWTEAVPGATGNANK